MADKNTIQRAFTRIGSTFVRAGEVFRRARLDFGRAHEPRQRARTALVAGFLACGVTALLLAQAGESAAIDFAETPLMDARVRMLENPARDPDILVIAIDDRALAHGDAGAGAEPFAWPWPRHVYNKLIRWCRAGGARVIVFDMVFSETGPNTNYSFVHSRNEGGGITRVWTADKAGDDLFLLEATAREDVCLALAMDTRPRESQRRDELLVPRAATIAGEDAAHVRRNLEPALHALQAPAAPFAGLLDGRPLSQLMSDLGQYPPDEQMAEVQNYYRQMTRRSLAFESLRYAGLLPLPEPTLRGVGGVGSVFVVPDAADGTLRKAMTVCGPKGLLFRHCALETWRLLVLSHAREDAPEEFARRYPGLALDGGAVVWQGSRYELAGSLLDAPVSFEGGRMKYLGVDVPVDKAGNVSVRYRRLLDAADDPVYRVSNEERRREIADYFATTRPIALYPTVSAADVLSDWDAWDLANGGWERRLEDLRRQLHAAQQEMEDLEEDERGPLRARAQTLSRLIADYPAQPPQGWARPVLGAPADLAKDKVVFIAGTAVALGDRHQTPWAHSTPGTYFLANVFDNLRNNDVMRQTPHWARWLLAMIAALAGTAAVMFTARLRVGLGLVLLLAGAVAGLSVLLFKNQVWLPTAAPLAGLAIGFTHGALAKALTEGRQRRQREAFARQYMGRELVDYVIRNPGSLKLGGENRPMTIYFSDVAGFTHVAETLGPDNPERLVELLNVYLDRMTDLMLGTGGVIDKYIGDAIMCFWGAPRAMEDHAVRAVRGALACRSELQRVQSLFADVVRPVAPQLIRPDGSVIGARAGINTGLVTVGNMGSSKRFTYTVMGDAVNLAARLEPLNKDYGTDILVGPLTAQAVKGEFTLRRIDLIVVVGRTEPTEVFEVLGGRDAPGFISELVAEYERGIDLYRDGQFENALEAFRKAATREPGKDKVEATPSKLYIQRCEDLIADPPQKGWTGTVIKKSK